MNHFRYRAKESSGQTVEGVVEAVSDEDAVEKVSQLGLIPIRIEEASSGASSEKRSGAKVASAAHKVKSKEITLFGRQLSSLIRSGVPILRAIEIVSEQSENPHFRNLLGQIHEEVKNGKPLSTALVEYPRIFPPLYLALVTAGELAGTLDQTLASVTDYRQKQEEVLSRIRTAMIYPTLMALTGIGTIIFMLTFVMPRLLGVFANLGGSLPAPTRILIAASTICQKGWYFIPPAVVGFLLFARMTKNNKAQRLAASALKLQLPVIGPLTLKAEMARFSRTLELLIKSGIPILKAIETAIPVLDNEVLKNDLTQCLQDLKEGSFFGRSLKKSKRFPAFMTNLITIGEESGKLDEALAEIALFYERQTDEAMRAMTALLEPLMILVMGLVVGFIVIAMLLPMFELNMMVR